MALVLNEEQRLLQDTTREFLAKHAPVEALRKLRDERDPIGYDPELWQQMAEMGWTSIIVPEAYGGLDFGFLGLGVVPVLAVIVVVARIHTTSRVAQGLKFDLAELDDIRYGLLDADVWVDHLLVVMDGQIESFGETPVQREEVQEVFESVIQQLDNVADVTVQAQKNPITGQIVCARVTLQEDEEKRVFVRRMKAFCRERLAPYKVPVKTTIVENAQHSSRFKRMRRAA